MEIRDLQRALLARGFDVGKAGADGDFGPSTLGALKAYQRANGLEDGIWLGAKTLKALAVMKSSAASGSAIPAVPADWIPAAGIDRITVHWTDGTNKAGAIDRASYHILIEGDGKLVRGVPTIDKNTRTGVKPGYAQHIGGCNSGSIDVSLCGMTGAKERPFSVGAFPLTQTQWNVLLGVCLLRSASATASLSCHAPSSHMQKSSQRSASSKTASGISPACLSTHPRSAQPLSAMTCAPGPSLPLILRRHHEYKSNAAHPAGAVGLGPLLAAFGVVDEAQWGALASQLSTVLGILAAIIDIAWQWWVSRPAAKIEQVAALPNVKRVVTDEATAQASPTPNITAR